MDTAPTPRAAPSRVAPDNALLEREAEVTALRDAVDAASQGAGSVTVVTGPPGIGKTRLLGEARRVADIEGFRVLSARAGELERVFPFGVVRQLFERPLVDAAEHPRWLEGAAAAVAPLFAGSAEYDLGDGSSKDVSFSVLHGLYWLTVNLAADGPLAIVVDDLHWCDRPSLRFLAYLAPRLDELPVALVVALRPGTHGPDTNLLTAATTSGPVAKIRPGPLTEAAVTALIEDRLGAVPDASFVDACRRATGGNPLLVSEVTVALAAERIPPDGAHTDAVDTVGPTAVARTLQRRLAPLPPDALAAARGVAVLGSGAEPPILETLVDLDAAALSAATSALVDADILTSGLPFGFVHPLVRDAVYEGISQTDRQDLHGRAAALLLDAGAPPERVASHLEFLAPQRRSWVVDVLRKAADGALHDGAPDSAVGFLRRALREGPTPAQRPDVLRELGTAESLIDAPIATEHLRAAYGIEQDPDARTAIADLLARLALFTGSADEAAAVARHHATELDSDLVDERRTLEAIDLYAVHFGAQDFDTAGRLATTLAGLDDTGPGSRSLLAVAAWDQALTGNTATECLALVNAALAGGVLIAADPALMSLIAASVLILADRDEAVSVCEAILGAAQREGSLFAVTGVHQCQGWNWLRRGELAEAEHCLRLAIDEEAVVHEATWNAGTPYAGAFLTSVLLERGDSAGAHAAFAHCGVPAAGSDAEAMYRCVQLEVLIHDGRFAEAEATAASYARRPCRASNPGWAPWRSLRGIALARLAERDEALELLGDEVDLARAWQVPGTLGMALRRLGVTRGGPAGLELLAEAAEVTAAGPAKLEHAKSLAAFGAALRRSGKRVDARKPLRAAADLATRCGAEPLATRAADELIAAGGRATKRASSGVFALTPSERRVADLVAAGHTNRGVAQALYVTPKTVETHLSNAYRKLGIRSRRQLAAALGSDDAAGTDPRPTTDGVPRELRHES